MVPVIDLFAGPGGLGEGFSSLTDNKGNPIFQTIMSVEKDEQAHRTLRLRSFFRKIYRANGNTIPRAYLHYMEHHDGEFLEDLKNRYPEEWEAADEEALCATLKDDDDTLVKIGAERLKRFGSGQIGEWVLIGGPPCQAYSLVGRSRRAHDKKKLEEDPKQTLYKCYLAFITALQPTAFVMENVKGLLSAHHKGEGVFDRICADMRDAGYEIRSLVSKSPDDPRDYIVESEKYGIPQMRHRVILLGVKAGCETKSDILERIEQVTLRKALAGIPAIRSGFSERNKGWREKDWNAYINSAIDGILETGEGKELKAILLRVRRGKPQRLTKKTKIEKAENPYEKWYRGRMGVHTVLANHESRTHLAADLDRYVFCAAYAELHGFPARISEFPRKLYPKHKNVLEVQKGEEIEFDDRFRVQLWDKPATTVTSHIAKDGHYYIHPDPAQCRSLTVREAARLQTFPDDYLFEGNRTSQYTQVGNAVPPLLAQQIGKVVAKFLGVEGEGFCDSLTRVACDDEISDDMDSRPSEA
jgi:DNA (cytosine-5)-methyltransferase 1